MCPIQSGTEMLTTQEAATAIQGLAPVPGRVNIQIIPKRAPCMKDCAIFDAKNNQCMAKTALEGLSKLVSSGGLGSLFGGGSP